MNGALKRTLSIVLAVSVMLTTCFSAVYGADSGYVGSASYTAGEYYDKLCTVTLTGDGRTDIVNIALSQVGYHEGANSSDLSGKSAGGGNYTEYGEWYGVYCAWCAVFVSWCAERAGISTDIINKAGFVSLPGFGLKENSFKDYCGYIRRGDILVIDTDGGEPDDCHASLVTDVDEDYIYTVDGNWSDSVKCNKYSAKTGKISYYSDRYPYSIIKVGVPDYKTVGGYAVSFNANGGKNAPANQTKAENESIKLSADCPNKLGYVFSGWATEPNSSTVAFMPGDRYEENKSVTLYAIWEKCTHSGYTLIKNGSTDIHPHYIKYKCSGCGETLTGEETVYNASCEKCVKERFIASMPVLKSAGNTTAGISIKWSAVSGATGYRIYRKTDGMGYKLTAKVGSDKLNFVDTAVKSGEKYTYTVRGAKNSDYSSYNKAGISCVFLSAPTVKSTSVKCGGVYVTWSAVNGASGYRLYRKVPGGNYKMVTEVDGKTATSVLDKSVSSSSSYIYTVRAVYGKTLSGYYSAGKAASFLSAPRLSSVLNTTGGVTLKWQSVSGAKQYYIYRKTSGGFKRIAEVKGTAVSFTDKNVNNNTAYEYTLRAVGADTLSSYYKGTAITFLAVPKLYSAASSKSGITVKFGGVTGADGYCIYRKTDGGWKKLADITGGNRRTHVDKTAQKGVTYTYTIRALKGSVRSYYDKNGISCKDKY